MADIYIDDEQFELASNDDLTLRDVIAVEQFFGKPASEMTATENIVVAIWSSKRKVVENFTLDAALDTKNVRIDDDAKPAAKSGKGQARKRSGSQRSGASTA